MRTKTTILAAALTAMTLFASLSGVACSGSSGAGDTTGTAQSYVADLEGYMQVPRIATSASGMATLTLSADKTSLSYHVMHNVANATEVHIHLGAAGENGAVAYPLAPVSADMTGTIALANATDAMNLDQGLFYINVHSPANPKGEVRGQILHPGETLYVASLTPMQETPATTATSSGTAQVIVDSAKAGFHYHVNSDASSPTAAHVHKGIATVASTVVLHEFAAEQTIDGTAMFASPGESDDLAQGRWYINVHTTANPKGEIRGQLTLPGESLYGAVLSDADEVPPVTSGVTGNAQLIVSHDGTSMRYELALFNIDTTMAHIHKGAVGIDGPVVYPLMLASGYSDVPNASAGATGTQGITAGDLADLNAGNWYTNVHSMQFAKGAARGQIGRLTP